MCSNVFPGPDEFTMHLFEVYGYVNICAYYCHMDWEHNKAMEIGKRIPEASILGWSKSAWDFVNEMLASADYDPNSSEYCFHLHRSRFVWFPLEPIGYTLGTTGASALFGLWSAFLATWVLEMLTLRIGGTKLYEGCGVPITSGAITGCMIGMILGGIMWIMRFFIPF